MPDHFVCECRETDISAVPLSHTTRPNPSRPLPKERLDRAGLTPFATMVDENGRLDTAVEQLCDVTEAVLNQTHENVWELDWESLDPTFEDPVHETVSFVKRFRRWQITGDHGMGLRPR